MTIYRGSFVDTPDDPFAGGALRVLDGALRVAGGAIVARDSFAGVRALAPDDDVVDLRDGVVLPGFVDTHVHFPQARVIGGLGRPLLEWLELCALPEEARLADASYAAGVADDFLHGLVDSGTTSALVFGSHFAPATDLLFTAAAEVGLRITSGLVVSDRLLRDDLLTTPERALAESLELAGRWHGAERARYAVTPRFALSCTDDLLAACREALDQVSGAAFTSHVNENVREIETVQELFGGRSYVGSYDKHGLLGRDAVLAHNVHPSDDELRLLASTGTVVSHCPTSNASLGSGLFPMRRHLDAGVRLALGSDVGGGSGYALHKEGLQAYFTQQLRGDDGYPLTPAHLLRLATVAGADALGLAPSVGTLSVGGRFDAQWIHPPTGSPLAVGLANAADASDALAKVFTMGAPGDIAGVWIDGDRVKPR